MAGASRAPGVPTPAGGRQGALSDALFRRNLQGQPINKDGTLQKFEFTRGPYDPSKGFGLSLRDMQMQSSGSTVQTPTFDASVPATLENLQLANAQGRAGQPVTGRVSPATEATAARAWSEGQRPQGPYDQAGWGNASQQLQQKLSAEASQAKADRLTGNEDLRRQMFARTGNRSPSTKMRGAYWMGPGAAAESPAPTGLGLDQQRELLQGVNYRDQQRAAARDRIQAGGGLPTAPRTGFGGLMDRLLPKKSYDIATDPRPGFADQAARIEGAKAKRQRYLAGAGEYEGRGPAARAASIAAQRAPVVANAMADKEERNWRMSGAPQQQAFENALAAQAVARSPMAGAAMFRARAAARESALNRDIQREELGLKRDMMRGEFDERRATRLDAMKMQQAQMGLEREQMTSQMGLGREGIGLQRELGQNALHQDELQHRERLEEMRRGRIPTATERESIIQSRVAEGQTREEATAAVDRETGGLGSGAPVGGEGAGGPAETPPAGGGPSGKISAGTVMRAGVIPPSLRQFQKPNELIIAARGQGYSEQAIVAMLRMRSPGVRGISVRRPKGPSLFSHMNPFQSGEAQDRALSDWWRNKMD